MAEVEDVQSGEAQEFREDDEIAGVLAAAVTRFAGTLEAQVPTVSEFAALKTLSEAFRLRKIATQMQQPLTLGDFHGPLMRAAWEAMIEYPVETDPLDKALDKAWAEFDTSAEA